MNIIQGWTTLPSMGSGEEELGPCCRTAPWELNFWPLPGFRKWRLLPAQMDTMLLCGTVKGKLIFCTHYRIKSFSCILALWCRVRAGAMYLLQFVFLCIDKPQIAVRIQGHWMLWVFCPQALKPQTDDSTSHQLWHLCKDSKRCLTQNWWDRES